MIATLQQAKDLCKIEHDDDDTLVTELLAEAEMDVQGYLRRPIGLELSSYVLEEPRDLRVVRVVTLPEFPIAAAGASAGNYSASQDVEITDGDGTTIPTTDYRVDTRTGQIFALGSFCFDTFPYTFVYAWGFGGRADYDTHIVPRLRGAILDYVADLYQRRNPGATTEATGGGVSTSYGQGSAGGIPQRIKDRLDALVMKRVL